MLDREVLGTLSAVVLMAFAIFTIWAGKVRLRGGMARRNENPIRFWFFVTVLVAVSTLGGIKALTAWVSSYP